MAEVKWIKLSVGLPDNKKIKQIRKLPNGDTIALMWVFLMCLAGETNDDGAIYFTPEIPFTDEMLADQFAIDVNTVRLALNTFERFGMIEIIDNVIHLEAWEKWQATDRLSEIREQNRIRQQRKRARDRQKLIGEVNLCAYCGEIGDTIDHVIAKTNGGLDVPENTVCCCSSCNSQKNNHDVVKFLNDRLLTGKKVDLQGIAQNSVLKKYVQYDFELSRYITADVTLRNATEEDKEKDIEEDKEKEIYSIIVSYLNEKAGTAYRATTAKTKTLIKARLAEGFNIDDFKTVIDKKCADWLNNAEYEKYLRPETLFGTKFEGYLNAKSGKGVTNGTDKGDSGSTEYKIGLWL